MELKIALLIIVINVSNVLAIPTDPLENSLLAIGSGTEPQQNRIAGTVKDEKGDPLPGVTVLVKGTTLGALTNASGKYTIDNAPQNVTLIFSFVGMTTQEIPSNGLMQIDVVLKEEAIGLEEVVVVGYGTQKKISLTGAIASVGERELKTISTSNTVTGLAGKLPGLRITQRSGGPGEYSTLFDIRGNGTPLIVIDGVPRLSTDFAKIPANEIESMSVLKDASAAVYGASAGNGVILITTKKGTIGKPIITYSYKYGVNQLLNLPKACSAYEFTLLTTEKEVNGAGLTHGSTTYSQETINGYKNGTIVGNDDWVGTVANNYGYNNTHNLTMTGGSEKIKYFTSLGYLDDMGLLKSGDDEYKKYNFRSSVTGKISDELSATLNSDGMWEDHAEAGLHTWNILMGANVIFPTTKPYANDNPQYLQQTVDFVMPFANRDIAGYYDTRTKTFQSNLTLDYKPKYIPGFSANIFGSFMNVDYQQDHWSKKFQTYNYDKVTQKYIAGTVVNSPSSLTTDQANNQIYTLRGQANYEKLFFESHRIAISANYEMRQNTAAQYNISKQFFIDMPYYFEGNSEQDFVSADGSRNRTVAKQSFIGKIDYDYLSKYILQVGFNYGASSFYPTNSRWGFFPYVSAGWRVSEEKFMKDLAPFITNLKIRASTGKMGDEGDASSANAFQFLSGFNYPSGGYVFNNSFLPALSLRGMPNAVISWIVVTSKNIGLDLNLKNGLFGSFDLFRTDRTGMYANQVASLPASVGVGLPLMNLNSNQTNGFEIMLGHTKQIGGINYSVSGNLTVTRTKNIYVERNPLTSSRDQWMNSPFDRYNDIMWGYRYIGQFQSYDEIKSAPIHDGLGNRSILPGDLRYADLNNDGVVNSWDQEPIGRTSIPNITYALNGSLGWKNFDVAMQFYGAANLYYTYNDIRRVPVIWGRNALIQWLDRWHHADPFDVNSAWIPGKFPATRETSNNQNRTSAFWTVNASYLRLKSLEIGYTLKDASLLNKAGIQSIRVYTSGFNLLTFSKLDDVDPEQVQGFGGTSYPISRDYNFGFEITF